MTSERYDAQVARQRLRERKPEDWEKKARETVEAHVAQGKLLSQSPPEFDETAWQARRRLEIDAPGVGVRDGSSMVVPLSFLKHHLDDALTSKSRKTPLYFSFPYHWVEVATVRAPPGWHVQQTPKTASAKGPVEAEVQVRQVGDALEVRREIRVTAGRYPPSEYARIRAAFALFQSARTKAITYVRAPGAPRDEASAAR